MNILFSAGGTLGHIYPAISLINQMLDEDNDLNIFFIANRKDQSYMETLKLSKKVKIIYYDAYGIAKSPLKLIKALIINTITYNKIKKTIIQNNIKLAIGMGGYISGITIKASKRCKIKTIIHEQNSILGLANKMSLKYTDLFLTTFPMTKYISNQYVVGNPRYFEASLYKDNILKSKYNLLIISGTLGAEFINKIASEFLQSSFSKKFLVTLITGKRYYNNVLKHLTPCSHFQVLPFSNNVLNLISQSGIVISRAGSSTIFEILGAVSIPILIPSPNVSKNHQYYNAKAIVDQGLGYMIEEKNLSLNILNETIDKALKNYVFFINKINKYSFDYQKNDMLNYIKKLMEGDAVC
ncbi:MAG: UDP-N-acetylglucosamine--N-acetylmuramyl-(pentapeptide) pyrophosphoryl-undecaprenol N-acetylglucosamine transferase [Bacilli bacterium]